jgi:hypothetical protein
VALIKTLAKRAIGMNRRIQVSSRKSGPARETFSSLSISTEYFGDFPCVDLALQAFQEAPLAFFRELWVDHLMWGGRMEGQYDFFDMVMLWKMIKHFGVRRVIECSPFKGWSTTVIQKGLEGRDAVHISFDIQDFEPQIRRNMAHHVPLSAWQFVLGDFKETILKFAQELSTVDLLFIDSDHSADFARWYLDEAKLPEQLHAGALMHVHDIYPLGREPGSFGESPYLLRWLQRHKRNYEIFYNYEVSRLRTVTAALPFGVFLNHSGQEAANCSIWIRSVGTHNRTDSSLET